MHHAFDEIMEGGPARAGNGLDGNDGYYDCDEVVGSGERHVKILPRAPHYEVPAKAPFPIFLLPPTGSSGSLVTFLVHSCGPVSCNKCLSADVQSETRLVAGGNTLLMSVNH